MTIRRTARWNVALAAALLASAAGALLTEPRLLLLSIPAVTFAAYSQLTATPPMTLELERSIADRDPSHGEEVEVAVTLRNAGNRMLPDVRIVDGVPAALPVASGTARHAATLGPGAETTFTYTIFAKRGVHRFEPATAVLGDASGGVAVEATVAVDDEIACRSPVRTSPLRRTGRRRAESATAADVGEGVEFARIRSYRPGDPPGRIDWNRYARSGELTTAGFRENRSRTTVLCLDARESCYRSSGRGEPHAVSYERAAARELLEGAIGPGESVGLAVLGAGFDWLPSATGSRHAATVRRALEDPETVPLDPPDERAGRGRGRRRLDGAGARALRTRVGTETGVIVLSPLLDEFPVETARALREAGNPVAVLSPDVTAARSLGTAMARLRRENRIDRLRRSGVPVVDWNPEASLEAAIRREVRR